MAVVDGSGKNGFYRQAATNPRAAACTSMMWNSWEFDPRKNLYLPEPRWEEQSHLAIFDEERRNPKGILLARDSRGVTLRTVL